MSRCQNQELSSGAYAVPAGAVAVPDRAPCPKCGSVAAELAGLRARLDLLESCPSIAAERNAHAAYLASRELERRDAAEERARWEAAAVDRAATFARFVSERVEFGTGARCQQSLMARAYLDWCESQEPRVKKLHRYTDAELLESLLALPDVQAGPVANHTGLMVGGLHGLAIVEAHRSPIDATHDDAARLREDGARARARAATMAPPSEPGPTHDAPAPGPFADFAEPLPTMDPVGV